MSKPKISFSLLYFSILLVSCNNQVYEEIEDVAIAEMATPLPQLNFDFETDTFPTHFRARGGNNQQGKTEAIILLTMEGITV